MTIEFSSVLEALREVEGLSPKSTIGITVQTVEEKTINESIGLLRNTKSIPPDFYDVLETLTDESEKKMVLNSLRRIYGYISSVQKSNNILKKFKAGKFENTSLDDNSSSLADLNKLAEAISKKSKKLSTVNERVLKIESKDARTNADLVRLDKADIERELLLDELVLLTKSFLLMIREVESSIAGLGLK